MISDLDIVEQQAYFIPNKKYNHKFGDMDLLSSGGLLNNTMTFGLFYEEEEVIDTSVHYIYDKDRRRKMVFNASPVLPHSLSANEPAVVNYLITENEDLITDEIIHYITY